MLGREGDDDDKTRPSPLHHTLFFEGREEVGSCIGCQWRGGREEGRVREERESEARLPDHPSLSFDVSSASGKVRPSGRDLSLSSSVEVQLTWRGERQLLWRPTNFRPLKVLWSFFLAGGNFFSLFLPLLLSLLPLGRDFQKIFFLSLPGGTFLASPFPFFFLAHHRCLGDISCW